MVARPRTYPSIELATPLTGSRPLFFDSAIIRFSIRPFSVLFLFDLGSHDHYRPLIFRTTRPVVANTDTDMAIIVGFDLRFAALMIR